jgi:hypothetical protein
VIQVSTRVVISQQYRQMIAALQPSAINAFMKRQGNNMVAQVRRNIVSGGGLASTQWAPLSPEYAKRKREGKTPGKGKFTYAILRDTGQLYESLSANVSASTGSVTVELVALGNRANGKISNAELLSLHHEGTSKMPARSPVGDMRLFEQRFGNELVAFLSGASGSMTG